MRLDGQMAQRLTDTMTRYFAYGANLDRDAMRQRCPTARLLGSGSLPGYRFIIMAAGYATVLRTPGGIVHGLVWDLRADDVAALDDYEEVEAGLYHHATLPILQDGTPAKALVYVAAETKMGSPRPGYLEAVIAAAERALLPAPYRDTLRGWLSDGPPAAT